MAKTEVEVEKGNGNSRFVALKDVGSENTHNINPAAVTAVTGVKTANGEISELHMIGGGIIKVAVEAAKVIEALTAL